MKAYPENHVLSQQLKRKPRTRFFENEEEKKAWLNSYEWGSLSYGYGATIIEETEKTVIFLASDTCD